MRLTPRMATIVLHVSTPYHSRFIREIALAALEHERKIVRFGAPPVVSVRSVHQRKGA